MHNIMKGEKFIADVYNALRSNPDLWNSSGFYDHITPPGAIAPDDHQQEYTFDQLELRAAAATSIAAARCGSCASRTRR